MAMQTFSCTGEWVVDDLELVSDPRCFGNTNSVDPDFEHLALPLGSTGWGRGNLEIERLIDPAVARSGDGALLVRPTGEGKACIGAAGSAMKLPHRGPGMGYAVSFWLRGEGIDEVEVGVTEAVPVTDQWTFHEVCDRSIARRPLYPAWTGVYFKPPPRSCEWPENAYLLLDDVVVVASHACGPPGGDPP
jgi:hypothetical protein